MNICIQNLGRYNEGILQFKWIELPMDEDDITEALESIDVKDGTRYEEYMIADYEAPFIINQYENIYKLNEFVEEYGNIFDLYDEAINDLSQYNTIEAGYKIMEICDEMGKECDIVSEEYMIEDVKRYAEEGNYLSIQHLIYDVSGAEDNTLVFIDGYANYSSLRASEVRKYLECLMVDFETENKF